MGLAIDGLQTRLTIRRAERTEVKGAERVRAGRYLEAMQRILGLDGAYHLHVEEAVPAHAGLGSGTHLALAVAAALRSLHCLPLDTERDAERLGRGTRSGAGIGLFREGGLVVDGGRRLDQGGPPPVVSRVAFPDEWRVLVVLDPRRQGLHGAEEGAAFARLPPFPESEAARLCRLVLMQVLPALAERDLVSFGMAIKEVQARLGDHFAPLQGGSRFNSPDVAAVLDLLDREGAYGIGQSSWGPTGFAFAPSLCEAERLAAVVRRHPCARALDIRICKGLNRGAAVIVGAP
jgi:beta-RFAP synthase